MPVPIDNRAFERTRRAILQAIDRSGGSATTIILNFDVPENLEDFGRGSSFAPCHQLAEFLTDRQLSDVHTIAWIPRSIEGHAVLPIIACDEIIMAPDAEFGNAGVDEKSVSETTRLIYRDIAGRRNTVPETIVEAMVDPSIMVLEVQTELGRSMSTVWDAMS